MLMMQGKKLGRTKNINQQEESAAAPKEIKCNESYTKSSSDEETDDLEDENAVQG